MSKPERIRLVLDSISTLALVVTAIVLVRATFTRQSSAAAAPSAAQPNLVDTVDLNLALQGHIAGSKDAKVVIVEFSDFQCPFCERFARETLPQLKRDFIETGMARFVYRNNPLESIHPFAMKASAAAECAEKQGKYWDMHDALFAHQRQLADSIFPDQARALRMNVDAFSRCMAAEAAAGIKADQAEASRLGVQSTPVFLLGRIDSNGAIKATRRINGAAPYETFKATIKTIS